MTTEPLLSVVADSSGTGQEPHTRVWEVQAELQENGSATWEYIAQGAEAAESPSLEVFETLQGKVMSQLFRH